MRVAAVLAMLALALSLSFADAINIDFYYAIGCTHCAATEKVLEKLGNEYELNITTYEVSQDADNRNRMFREYERFGVGLENAGVPTLVVRGKAFVVGELTEQQWRGLFDAACKDETCPTGVITQKNFDNIVEGGRTAAITWPVLIGAALVDSINPCTIAVMVMLLSTIFYAKGRKESLFAGVLFSAVIFIMYMLYGLGILHAITTFELSHMFYLIVTVGALALALMEINAYFNYKPGFLAVEMPTFLRPYAKRITEQATSPAGVVIAAFLCSLFLLPCSSGPYLMVLGMIAKAATLQTITYLVVYNLFFILPMIIITAGIYVGRITLENVGEWKERYIRELHLISGIILFALFLIMLNELFEFV